MFTPAPARLASNALSVQSLPSELRPWPGFCLLWEELALTRLLNIPGVCLSALSGHPGEVDGVWGLRPTLLSLAEALVLQAVSHRGQRGSCSQACLWPCCYGDCLMSPSGPSPKMLRTRATPLPLLPNMSQPTPALVAGTFQDQGLASFSVALICPQHPSAQVFLPAELSPPPAQKVEGRRSPLQPFTVAADSHLQTSTGPFSVPPAHSGCPREAAVLYDRPRSGCLLHPPTVSQHCFSLTQDC